ncbi:MAG TPA: DNA recombination protein RmuC [Candidatus Bathyarchaeia archaeon]|nr:DNA recombination protein RmuC [Candidatus Bathyarchaeia archaeon]
MNAVVVIVIAAVGAVAGAVVSLLIGRSKAALIEQRKSVLEQELASTRAAAASQAAEIRALTEARSALQATLEAERRSTDEKLRLLQDASEQLKAQFKALAGAALESNNANFLQLAKSVLQNYQTQAAGELAQKEQAVRTLVEPINQSLAGMNQQIQALEKTRAEAYGTLTSQVASLLDTQRALQAETGNLVKALREPQARGRWGELQLHRVLELAGMLEYCDFKEQLSFNDEERRFRPDVIVDLPGGKQVVVDAKVPLTAYLEALEAPDELTRKVCIDDHARQVRNHIDSLAGKMYWSHLPCTPEFVVLFLPGEVFFRAAVDGDPELIEYGVSQKVIVTSPTTLIALLKAVAYGWNQKNLAESAKQISEAGKTLYERLCKMTEHFEALGRKLGGAVESYNDMVASIERRVLPMARKFPELDRSLAADSIPELPQLDKTVRELQAQDWQETLAHPELPLEEEKADTAKA